MFFSPRSFPREVRISGRHGESQESMGNPREGKIPGMAKSPGLQKPRDSKFLGMAPSPGGQNPQDNKIPGTAKSREIPGNPGHEVLVKV